MSIKKILIIAVILSLLTIGAVSAFSAQSETNNLIKKNGYEAAPCYATGVDNFTKGSDNILVGYVMNETLTLNMLEDGFEEKTINNTVGFYKQNSTGTYFHYNCGDDVILLMATDGGIIEKIVLGNEAPSL